MRFLALLYFSISCFSLCSIDLFLPHSAIQEASNGIILLNNEPASTAINPAILSNGFQTNFENRFSIEGLNHYYLQCSAGTKIGYHFSLSYLDYLSYRKSKASLSFSYELPFLRIGLAGNYLRYKISEYDSDSSIFYDIGIFQKKNNCKISLVMKNFSQAKISHTYIPITFISEINFQYQKTAMSCKIEKEKNHDFALTIGSAYHLKKLLTTFISYNFNPDIIGSGISIKVKSFYVSYGVQFHRQLDYSHAISLTYDL